MNAAMTAHDVLVPVVCVSTMVALAFAFLFVYDRIFRRRLPTKEQMAVFAKHFKGRLLNPDIQSLEKHFAHALPADIKALYQNREEILSQDFEVVGKDASGAEKVWSVDHYQPADLENVRDAWPDTKQVFEFANDGCGNGYTIDPRLENPPVMFYDHETGAWEKVADNFTEFMAMPRRKPNAL
jgi:hypothetical protein